MHSSTPSADGSEGLVVASYIKSIDFKSQYLSYGISARTTKVTQQLCHLFYKNSLYVLGCTQDSSITLGGRIYLFYCVVVFIWISSLFFYFFFLLDEHMGCKTF